MKRKKWRECISEEKETSGKVRRRTKLDTLRSQITF